ncbi:UNVERIFIED_CONTAM: Retrovirus-related Pol polyprotein from transposon TNT 1-94 [Sesamum latifolium]|uniref:Retrovirus-related Pol polyprotein from transposon TNT 1-94 n=1 Tax=Sesamum latifolium TaxID=2727402 RepID=A0AAW2UV10_9LAMI
MAESVKEMTAKFSKLDKFEGVDFRRWQKKMHFLLTTLKVVYVLSTPFPDYMVDETVEQTRRRSKWENDDYICRGHILNGMSDTLFDIYQNVESAKALWDGLEAKYMAEDASSKKFLEEMSLVQLGSHLRIEESLRARNDKPKGKDVAGSSSVNMVEDRRATKTMTGKGKRKVHDNKNDGSNKKSKLTCWKCGKSGHFKRDCVLDDDVAWWIDSGATTHACKDRGWFKEFQPVMMVRCCIWKRVKLRKNLVSGSVLNKCGLDRAVVRLPEPKKKSLGERVNTVIESRDAIFDETRFSSIPRPKKIIPSTSGTNKETESFKVTPDEPIKLRKSKRVRKPKSFGPDFQLYLIEGSRDEVSTLYPYCFNVEDDPKIFDEAMKSQDVAFWKEAINDEMDSIMGNNTWVLADLPPGCKPLGCKWIFKKKMKVDGTIEKFKARLVIQGFRQRPGIDYFDTYAPVARISTIRLIALASIHNLVIHQMNVKTAFLNGDLDEEVYMKQPEGFIMPGNEHKVCKLIKSLYGLKQAPKQWHQKDEVV